jgi:hypothetical protein
LPSVSTRIPAPRTLPALRPDIFHVALWKDFITASPDCAWKLEKKKVKISKPLAW